MTERKRLGLVSCGIILCILVAGLVLFHPGAGPAHAGSGSTLQPATGPSADHGGTVPGTAQDVQIQSATGVPAGSTGNGTGASGTASAVPAAGQAQDSTRSWLFAVNTSAWPPDEYFVVATSARPRVMAAAYFCVAEPPAGFLQQALSAPAQCPEQPASPGGTGISIDPIPGHYVGDRFTLTGTTNLAAGDEILVVITPVSFGPTEKNGDRDVGGTSGMATVLAAGPAGSG